MTAAAALLLLGYMSLVQAACGYRYAEGDIVWDSAGTIKYPLICIGAGMCAGLFGIGGGIVTGPLMLELGIHPQVGAARRGEDYTTLDTAHDRTTRHDGGTDRTTRRDGATARRRDGVTTRARRRRGSSRIYAGRRLVPTVAACGSAVASGGCEAAILNRCHGRDARSLLRYIRDLRSTSPAPHCAIDDRDTS